MTNDDAAVAGTLLRRARLDAGLTQRDLASAAGVAQSVISAYESGRRQPSLPTLLALVRAARHDIEFGLRHRTASRGVLGGPLGRRLREHRDAIAEIADRHGATNLRVFGSAARGDDTADSDVDLLVDLPDSAGLFTILRLKDELETLLRAHVDVIPSSGLRPDVRDRVAGELVAL